MRELQLKAMAKINLGLDVVRRREDGYHDLRMIMQTVRLYDHIVLRLTRAKGIRVKTNLGFLPVNEGNLVYRAAQLLLDEFPQEEGIYIDLDKHIPVAAGLAGGSADAAAVLFGLNKMLGLGLSTQQLMERGVKLGADIPYCILRGTALAEGIGERLTVLQNVPACFVVLAKPGVHVSTKFVYTNLHLDEKTRHPDIDAQVRAIGAGDLHGICRAMGNVLETVTIPAFPVIEEIKQQMLSLGAMGAMMSGSGPTVFGLFDTQETAHAAYTALRSEGAARQVWMTTLFQPAGRAGFDANREEGI